MVSTKPKLLVLLHSKRHSKAVVHRCSSNRSQMFFKIDVIKKFAKFARKHLYWGLFLINFVKKRLQYRYFPLNIAKSLKTAHRTPPVAASTGAI